VCHVQNRDVVLSSKRDCQFMVAVIGGKPQRLCPDPNAFHPRKGKPERKPGTQSHGPSAVVPVVARLPKGWAGEEPVRPRMPPLLPLGALVSIRGLARRQLRCDLSCCFSPRGNPWASFVDGVSAIRHLARRQLFSNKPVRIFCLSKKRALSLVCLGRLK